MSTVRPIPATRLARGGRTTLRCIGAVLLAVSIPAVAVGASPSPGPGTDAAASGSPTPVASSPAATLDPTQVSAAATRLADLAGVLETDRLLLVELRKSIPATRTEAEAYLANVEALALAEDSARLGVIVSRVRDAAPAYLDWRAQQFASQAEAATAYVQSGAAAFDATWSTLRDAILLTVANRIDGVLDIVDEMRGGQ